MKVTLLSLGAGNLDTMTGEVLSALSRADLVVGAQRLLDELSVGAKTCPLTRAEEILDLLRAGRWSRPCVVFSGDAGFYSGCRRLSALLEGAGISFRVVPGVSSVQYLASRLGRPWQDWNLCSAHAGDCDPVAEVCRGRPAFFLTGGERTPDALCARLTRAGLGTLEAAVGENLGCREERVRTGTAAQLSGERFSPLSVLLVEPAPRPRMSPVTGIPDEEFARGEVPMTKREVRCMALSLMETRPGETVWDVGAGTGSVAVELALTSPDCRVWAVERREEGCALIRENRVRFGAWNLEVVRGAAPAALGQLPAPQRVFIGGTGGYLTEILDAALDKSPDALVCVSAIAVETLGRAVQAMGERGMDPQVTQIAAARARGVGGLHMMMGQNPVWLITGRRERHA